MKNLIYTFALCVALIGGYSYNNMPTQDISSVVGYYNPDLEVHYGTLPIIISAPHGGRKTTNKVKDRDCNNCQLISDGKTIELATQIARIIKKETGQEPSLIYTNRHRKEIDLNRSKDIAYSSKYMSEVYSNYHNEINNMINLHDKSIYLDIHGHNHSSYDLELGYNMSNYDYKKGCEHINKYKNKSTVYNFYNKDFDLCETLYSKHSFPEQFSNKYKTIPSDKHRYSDEKYFKGGYSVQTHSKSNTVYAVQIEVKRHIRYDKHKRDELAKQIALAAIKLMKENKLNSKKKNYKRYEKNK